MGEFVRDLLLEQNYFETIFPRIPEVARREIVARIKELGFSDRGRGCGGQGGSRRQDTNGRPQSGSTLSRRTWGDERPVVVVAAAIGETIGGEIIAITAIVIATTTEIVAMTEAAVTEDDDDRRRNSRDRSHSPGYKPYRREDKYDKYDRYDKYDKYDRRY